MGHGLQNQAGNARRKILLLGDLHAREVECARTGRGPVFLLKERMRARGGHLGKVGLDGSECLVFGSVEEIRELSLVNAVVVDLLVMEPGGTDEGVRREAREGMRAQPRVGCQRPILGKPLQEGTGAHAYAETLLDPLCHAPTRLAPVVETEALQDHLERGALPLHDLWREDAVAVVAEPELDRLQVLTPLAFPGDAWALTVDTALGIRTDEGLARRG
jgi:hypothetical protein